jgi:hypothetical protein
MVQILIYYKQNITVRMLLYYSTHHEIRYIEAYAVTNFIACVDKRLFFFFLL